MVGWWLMCSRKSRQNWGMGGQSIVGPLSLTRVVNVSACTYTSKSEQHKEICAYRKAVCAYKRGIHSTTHLYCLLFKAHDVQWSKAYFERVPTWYKRGK